MPEEKAQQWDPQADVEAFMAKHGFARGIPDFPVPEEAAWQQTGAERAALVLEEAGELLYAWAKKDLAGVGDALADLLYVTFGAAVAAGIDLRPLFEEVHRSNMTKKPGGGLKPRGDRYEPPDVRGILERQLKGRRGARWLLTAKEQRNLDQQ